jgi:cyanamide hydratase
LSTKGEADGPYGGTAGAAIADTQFPDWQWDKETFLLACLFHDLGCTEEMMKRCVSFSSFFQLLRRRGY